MVQGMYDIFIEELYIKPKSETKWETELCLDHLFDWKRQMQIFWKLYKRYKFYLVSLPSDTSNIANAEIPILHEINK